MPFNIGSQQAGAINNVEGNQTIYGGQTGNLNQTALLDRFRQELAAVQLPAHVAAQVHAELDAVGNELGAPQPDRQAAVGRLGRVVGWLKSAGILATAGTGLLTALTALVSSFDHLGEPIRQLLT